MARIASLLLLTAFAFNPGRGRAEPRFEAFQFTSRALHANPLHDPDTRAVAVFLPTQYSHNKPLPVVYYLPGYGGSSEGYIKSADRWRIYVQKLADEVTPMLLVVVDGRNRWGGSQYINSPAQGNYADYVCSEIVAQVESRFGIATNNINRIIAGHSSGGFGALRLGMYRPKLFQGVVALSPDSDFMLSHLPLMQSPAIANTPLASIQQYAAPDYSGPPVNDGALRYALGLSAAYAPHRGWQRRRFDWLYDAQGRFCDNVWQRWMENDPLTIVSKHRNAFRADQAICVEGPTQDSYKANVGAEKIYEVLRRRPARCTVYQPAGGHGDRVPERLERGLAWLFDRPMQDLN